MEFAGTMGFSGMFVRPTVLQSWASTDPVNAAKYYEQNPREFAMMGMGGGGGRGGRGPGMMGGGFQSAPSLIAGEWAKQDPQAALAWANGLEREKSGAISSVIGQVAKDDPAKAAQMLAGLSPEDSGSSYRRVAEAYGAKNFAEAQAWVQSLPADQQADAMASAISGLAKTNPQAAATQVAAMQAGEAKDTAVGNVVSSMARQDPQRAAEFLAQNASPDAQSESMRDIMPNWVNKDATAAYNYANSLPTGPVRDSALRSYLWSNNTAEPSTLVTVAETISDEGDRNRTVGWMVGRWMREDEAAARAYVERTTSISDQMKQHILGEQRR
ncbi:MAG TPA: hypothetical protein VFY13_05275, partial [Luteolibacter sp.]|nr:hypothetical protein [Luteolibacter sp.]